MKMIKIDFSTPINGHSFLRIRCTLIRSRGQRGPRGRHGVGGTEAAETGTETGAGRGRERRGGGGCKGSRCGCG